MPRAACRAYPGFTQHSYHQGNLKNRLTRQSCFPRSLAEIDDAAIASLAEQLGVDAALHSGNDELDRTTKRHRAEIRTFFGLREATVDDGEDLLCWLRDHVVAESRDDDRLAAALQEECRRRRIEPPALCRFGAP